MRSPELEATTNKFGSDVSTTGPRERSMVWTSDPDAASQTWVTSSKYELLKNMRPSDENVSWLARILCALSSRLAFACLPSQISTAPDSRPTKRKSFFES